MNELRAGNPIVAGEVTIVPIEHCYIMSIIEDVGSCFYGLKEPFAIIICDAIGIRAIDTEGIEISVESLIKKISDLGALLESSTQKLGWQEE